MTIWSIFIAYILVLFVYWTPESHNTLSYLSIPVWIIFIIHIATIAGPLRVPLLIAIIAVMIIGFVTDVEEDKSKTDKDTESKNERLEEETTYTKPKVNTDWSFKRLSEKSTGDTISEVTKPSSLAVSSPLSSPRKYQPEEDVPRSLTSQCFMALLWGHVLVRLWMHLWIILLILVLPFVLMLFKKLGSAVSSEGMLGDKIKSIKKTSSAWFESRKDVLVPRCVRSLLRLALKGDGKIITVLEQGMDKMTSILLILALLIGTLIFTIVGAIQIHQESMLMVTMSSTLLNDTLHPEISQWLPDSKDMTDAMDSMVGNAYVYGRDWIASKVRDLVDDGTVNSTHIEQQVLEVWDRLYQSWFSKNTSTSKPSVDLSLPDYSNISAIWEYVSRGDGLFDVSSAVTFVQDNIGTFMSVFDSVWVVVKGNMNLISSLLTAIMSMILGGGTAILNFVISAVIFLTTLFYLLASSGKTYKPVEWFTSMSPTSQGGNTGFGQAVEEAISSVFMASLKMSAFYGLYTWLTHVMFDVDIVFIPSVLAAIFGAVPFVGTYWAAVPGALELWVLKGEGIMAIVLIIFHMLPAYVIDTAIYSEIKGGHPFMTGLAIAGGMYCLGLEGAFIGPILLCCLIVVVNMYGTMLQQEPSTPSGFQITNPKVRGLKLQDVKRSMSADE